VVPFQSPYRPLWLGLGTLSFDMLLVLAVTSFLRSRIGYRTWRGIHWLAYASWPVAVLHGLGTGTDTKVGPVLLLTGACLVVVLGVVVWRLSAGWPAHAGRKLAGGTAASAFVVASVAFVVSGPLRPGWAVRAGTPASLLTTRSSGASSARGATSSASGSGGAVSGGAASPAGGSLPTTPFTAIVTGLLTSSQPDASGQVTIDISGQLSGGVTAPFRILLQGTAAGGGGVNMTSGQVSIGNAEGTVIGLDRGRILSAVTSNGVTERLVFALAIDNASGVVHGMVEGPAAGTGDDSGGSQP
ncbi:MAG: hypothetical protein ACYCZV_09635, partial [Acidimicrobiales bacterium]